MYHKDTKNTKVLLASLKLCRRKSALKFTKGSCWLVVKIFSWFFCVI